MSIAKPTQEELQELYFLFPDNSSAAPRFPDFPTIDLSESELDTLIFLLGPKSKPEQMDETSLRNQLAAAAKWFPRELYYQNMPSLSERERKFIKIQKASRDLLKSLGVTSGSFRTLPYEIEAFLQIAASKYGITVGRPSDIDRWANHGDFWAARKLPSVIVGISLLEHWAAMAQADLRRQIEHRRTPKRRHPGHTAMRVLIHRLAGFWWHWNGSVPGAGYHATKETADGPFIRFAKTYIRMMQQHTTAEHFRHLDQKGLHAELNVTNHSIRAHVRGFKARLNPEKAESARQKH